MRFFYEVGEMIVFTLVFFNLSLIPLAIETLSGCGFFCDVEASYWGFENFLACICFLIHDMECFLLAP
jgi:hypothetical protein